MNTISENVILNTQQTWRLKEESGVRASGIFLTNPFNRVKSNRLAGGDHTGINLEPPPSYDVLIRPKSFRLLEFTNNTMHSFRYYGLRVSTHTP